MVALNHAIPNYQNTRDSECADQISRHSILNFYIKFNKKKKMTVFTSMIFFDNTQSAEKKHEKHRANEHTHQRLEMK